MKDIYYSSAQTDHTSSEKKGKYKNRFYSIIQGEGGGGGEGYPQRAALFRQYAMASLIWAVVQFRVPVK